ncbi:unnamed protein product [Dicrocoelium dendriticum]|nr:unnamed protein product [Dicrocoelium dendriticum]
MAEGATEESNTSQLAEKKASVDEPEQTQESDPPLFKCVVLGAYGGSKQVKVERREVRKSARQEIEVTVEACGVNFLDVMMRQGLLDQAIKPPFIMGSECAGIVTAVGEGVTNYKIGDKVVVLSDAGAWTEKLIVPSGSPEETQTDESKPAVEPSQTLTLPWPDTLSASQAAVLGFAYIPAYLLIHRLASIRRGDVVLVHSAGGGVGTAIGQLAKCTSEVTLIGIASKEKHEKLTSLYNHLFTPEQEYMSEIKKLYPQGIDVVLDCLSGEEMSKSYGILKPLGRYILYGMSNLVTGDRKNFFSLAKHWLQSDRINPLRLYDENHVIGGFCLKSMLFPHTSPGSVVRATAEAATIVQEVWSELCKLIDSKTIDPWIDSEWSFDETKEAMMRLQERKNIGKVVLLPKALPRKPEQATVNQQTGDLNN